MADLLSLISIVAFAIADISLVITIILFVRFKIPSVIGDLSGKNARRSIEQMREMNEKRGSELYKSGKVNVEMKTVLLKDVDTAQVLTDDNITRQLQDNNVTEILKDNNMTVMLNIQQKSNAENIGGIPIEIIEEVMFVHSKEVIL